MIHISGWTTYYNTSGMSTKILTIVNRAGAFNPVGCLSALSFQCLWMIAQTALPRKIFM